MYNLGIPGYMSERELKIIEQWSSTVPHDGVILEFGSALGRSSYCWAASCHPSVKVYCVDFFMRHKKFKLTNDLNPEWPGTGLYDIWEEFKKNTKDLPNIIPLRGFSPNLNYPGDKIDIFFMDGNHKNPNELDNFNFYKQFFNEHVLLCGHDYCEECPDVIANVKLFEEMYQKKATIHPFTCLWSIQL